MRKIYTKLGLISFYLEKVYMSCAVRKSSVTCHFSIYEQAIVIFVMQ